MPRALDFAATSGRRLFLFSALYFAQGVPWGFVSVTLALYFTSEGLGPAAIGGVLALAYLPWTFKPLFGPMADKLDLGRHGRYRPWILAAELGMGMTLLLLAGVDPGKQMKVFVGLIFAHNLFAAAQDVGVDALAVELLGEHERGTANSLMWASKYAGVAAGGSGLSAVGAALGWRWLFLIMAALIVAIALLPLFSREPPRARPSPAPRVRGAWTRADAGIHAAALLLATPLPIVYLGSSWSSALVYGLFVVLFLVAARTFLPGATPPASEIVAGTLRSFALPATFSGLLLVLVAEAGSGILGPMWIPLLKKKLAWSDAEVGTLSGMVGSASAVVGSLLGGVLSDRIGRRRAIGLFSIGSAAVYLAFSLLENAWTARPLIYGYTVASGLFEGMLTATLLSLCMDLSNPQVGGTQFTTFMAVSNVKHSWTAYVGGRAAEALSATPALMFALAAGVQLVALALLPLCDPRQAARAFRNEEGRPLEGPARSVG